MSFRVDQVRDRFPSLETHDNHRHRVYLDNPGGTQVPQYVLDRMQDYFIRSNANRGGAFRTSLTTDALLIEAREAVADFLNAPSPEEIVFGSNMTTLTFSLSQALRSWIEPGDEIIITRLDHDANISPWLRLAEDCGALIRWLDFNISDCTLRMDQLANLLNSRTRIVAVGHASNVVGTINPVSQIADLAHGYGALVFVDAVHSSPHSPIDVQDMNADLLVISAYKFFGPHLGILWGKREILDRLRAYKVRPALDHPPDKFETGTQSYEAIAGTIGALEHLAWIGQMFGNAFATGFPHFTDRRLELHTGMASIKAYEQELSAHLIDGLKRITGVNVLGITNSDHLEFRVPTISFTLERHHPRTVVDKLATNNIFVWDGHHYAIEIVAQLGLAESGGMVRVGAVHYNTIDELDKLLEIVAKLAH